MEIIHANVGEGGISQFDLDSVKVPAGGGTAWEVPSLEGLQNVNALEGIIIHWHDTRGYWKGEYAGGSDPPQCSSQDCKTGEGDPGGDCASCPYSKFGSAVKGEGQACKQSRSLYLVRPGDILPIVVVLPPTSILPMRKYFLRLLSAAAPTYAVVTRLTLGKATSGGGITYSVATPASVSNLSDTDIGAMKQYAENLKGYLRNVAEASQYEEEPHPFEESPNGGPACFGCGAAITPNVKTFSEHKHGRPLCQSCQKQEPKKLEFADD